MENKTPSQIWTNKNPADKVLSALQTKLTELAAMGIEIDDEEQQQIVGSWPYEDHIHLHTFTIQSENAYATAEWEDGQNDGSMEDWTSLTVKLYGDDPCYKLHSIRSLPTIHNEQNEPNKPNHCRSRPFAPQTIFASGCARLL